jgi:hypothetical protein
VSIPTSGFGSTLIVTAGFGVGIGSRADVRGSDFALYEVIVSDASAHMGSNSMGYNIHDLGDVVRVSSEFTDPQLGGVIDPDTVKLSIRSPDGAVVTLEYGVDDIAQDDVGQYRADISVGQSGTWHYRWFSEGNGQAAEERRFVVREAQAVGEE